LILVNIQLEPLNENLIVNNKLSKYTYLLDSINIFTETLSLEQIFYAASEVFRQAFQSEPVIYQTIKDEFQILSPSKDHPSPIHSFELTEDLKRFALFSATVITEKNMEKLIPETILKALQPNYAVPLIIAGNFSGMIFLKVNIDEDLKEFDVKSMNYLMRLIQISLEKYEKNILAISYEKEANTRYFNLKALHALSHSLFSELHLESVFQLAVDAFLEITTSEKISFVLFDPQSENYRSKAQKFAVGSVHDAFEDMVFKKVFQGPPPRYKNPLDLKQDMDQMYFNSLFECVSGSEFLNSYRYIVLIFDNEDILGFLFVTETVNGNEFSESLADVVDILSTNTFLAIKNAKLFSEVEEKNQIIENKLNNLLRLNTLMDNINSAEDSKTMLSLITDTLQISFDVNMGFFALYDKDLNQFTVCETIQMDSLLDRTFEPQSFWSNILKGETFTTNSIDCLFDYFERDFILEYSFDSTGLLIKPMCMGYEGHKFLGVACLFEHKSLNLTDFELNLYIDSIINHTTPMLWNLLTIENLKKSELSIEL
jgi:hypothetical protein